MTTLRTPRRFRGWPLALVMLLMWGMITVAQVVHAPVSIAASGVAVTSSGGAFTLTTTASTTSLPKGGGTVNYTYTVKNTTSAPLYFSGLTDTVCTPVYSTGLQTQTLWSWWDPGHTAPKTVKYIPANQTATWTCAGVALTASTTNNATARLGTATSEDSGGNFSVSSVQSATAQATVTVAFDVSAACNPPYIIYADAMGAAISDPITVVPYTVDPATGSVTAGSSFQLGNTATGWDIAISPDGTKMYTLAGTGLIRVFDMTTPTHTFLGSIQATNLGVTWGNANNTNVLNALAFGPDGNLYFGGKYQTATTGGNNKLYRLDPNVALNPAAPISVTAQSFHGSAQGQGVVPYGFAGDFVALPDGSILGLALTQASGGDSMGTVKFVIYPRQADGTPGAPVDVGFPAKSDGTQLSQVWGMTHVNGSLYLASSKTWYELRTLPTTSDTMSTVYRASAATLDSTLPRPMAGATGRQDASTSCTSSNVTLGKSAGSVTGPDANSQYTANYTVTVTNPTSRPALYGAITDTPQLDPVFTAMSATWSGPNGYSGSATGAGPYAITTTGNTIAANTTLSYTVAVKFTWNKTTLPAACGGPGTGLYNRVSAVGADGATNTTANACAVFTSPLLSTNKTAGSVTGPDANGTYSAAYTLVVSNAGNQATTYGALVDTPSFSSKFTPTGATWSATSTTPPGSAVPLTVGTTSATGAGPYGVSPSGTSIAANTSHSYNLSVSFTSTYAPGDPAQTCNGPGTGLYNTVSLPAGQDASGPADNSACATPPAPVASSISGTVYADANNDASLNTGDAGLSGKTLTLKNSGGTVVQTVQTNANGAYTFSNVAPGSYTVTLSDPITGKVLTQSYTVKDTDGSSTSVAAAVVVAGSVTGVDFGLYDPVTITLEKQGETGVLAGAQFEVRVVSGSFFPGGTTAAKAMTPNAAGTTFTSPGLLLTPARYQIVETKSPAGYSLLAAPVVFDVLANGTVSIVSGGSTHISTSQPLSIVVVNERALALPLTGGVGAAAWTFLPVLFLLFAGLYVARRRKTV